MENVSFICPVCGEALNKTEKSFVCPAGHCFDIARQGYVNLLTGSARGRHGDDALMVSARAEFLDKGYYDALAEELASCAVEYSRQNSVILDAGCGEGKYTVAVLDAVHRTGLSAVLLGTDISKEALKFAARRSAELHLAVASSASLPLGNESVDMVLNVFSPFIDGEFHRVLKTGGHLIRVIPMERHLWELKEIVYEHPYENIVGEMQEDGFEILEKRHISYPFTLNKNEEIMSLFKMTPYYYKTGRTDQEKAEKATSLDLTADFGLIIYIKTAKGGEKCLN